MSGRSRFGTYGDPRDRPQRADGSGQQLHQQRAQQAHEARMNSLRDQRDFEAKRVRVPAPVLRSLAEIEQVVEEGPSSPIYVISRNGARGIASVGRAVFGEQGYNRFKKEEVGRGIGPHFDAYAKSFNPWTIHRNQGSVRTVRAAFLPDEQWQQYIAETDGLTDLGVRQQERRFAIGKELFNSGIDLTTAKVGDQALTLLWHGDLSRPDLPGPSVHEFRGGLPNLISGTMQDDGTYVIYARQNKPGRFEGFIEV